MKVFTRLDEYKKGMNPVATIGTFDGVHLGHRKILQQLIDDAKKANGESVVISFNPHPRLVLFPDDNPLRLLHSVAEKTEMLASLGIDKLMLIPFTKEFSRYTSSMFIRDVLVECIGIHKIIVGYDHHFGKNRTGGLADLEAGGLEHGFAVAEIPAEQIDHANISSTKIRHALAEGDMETATKFLGYPYPLTGTVMHGQQLGRELGYPTANIHPDDALKQIPAEGVYLVEVIHDGSNHYGMLNIGHKPTVGNFPLGIEVNIFDFSGDIYGHTLRVNFLRRIREDKKFASLEDLRLAIDNDKLVCLELIQSLR
jgi:riboflavin kinase / FMN adenylyltransferase